MNFKEYMKEGNKLLGESKSLNESSTLIDLGVDPKQIQSIAKRGMSSLIPDAKAQWNEIKSKVELKKVFTDKGNVIAVINPDGTLNLILKNPQDWTRNQKIVRLYIIDPNGKMVSSSKETVPKAISRAGKGKYYYTKSSARITTDPERKQAKNDKQASFEFAGKIENLINDKAKKLYEEFMEEVKQEVMSSLDGMDFVKAHEKLSAIVGISARFMSTDPYLRDYKSLYTGGDSFRKLIANMLEDGSGSRLYRQDAAFEDATPQEIREASAAVLKELKQTNTNLLNKIKGVVDEED